MAGPSKTPKTPAASAPPSLKKSTSGSQSGQKSIASFFQKRALEGQQAKVPVPAALPIASQQTNGLGRKTLSGKPTRGSSSSLTPAPSSDAIQHEDAEEPVCSRSKQASVDHGLPSPVTPASAVTVEEPASNTIDLPLMFDSPSRKVGTLTLRARRC